MKKRMESVGWEDYYASAGSGDAWSDEPDPEYRRLMDTADSLASGKAVVLDIGCGDGRNMRPWLAAGWTVVGIDGSRTAVERVSRRFQAGARDRPIVVHADMRDLPFGSGTMTAVQCLDVLPQIRETSAALLEFARVVENGGHLLFNVFTPGDCAFGEGRRIAHNTYAYKQTVFKFFDDGEIEAALPSCLRVVQAFKKRWEDPPHVPFRPYAHVHEAWYLLCCKEQ